MGPLSNVASALLTRRSLIIASLATAAFAQAASGKVWRVGYLCPGDLDNASDRAGFNIFRSELERSARGSRARTRPTARSRSTKPNS